jgi:hypothetical protein
VYASAPRLDRSLLDAIAAVDDPSVPIAETYRRIRELTAERGIPRPSYERVRLHIKEVRRRREQAKQARERLIAVALYRKPVHALYESLDDDGW